MCIFATAYKRKVSCFARKALRYCPLSGIRQNSYGRMSILLSLVVYAMGSRLRICLRRETDHRSVCDSPC